MSNIKQYLPSYYDNIKDFETLMEVEDSQLDTAYQVFDKLYKNQFVETCDEEGILKFEKLLNIIANPTTESLQFRIDRVLKRLNQNPPFTLNFLKLFLDDILGKNKYNIFVENMTLYLESSTTDQQWFEEIRITINGIKPCNIKFVNNPILKAIINVNEKVLKSATGYAQLGTFKLGTVPFIYKEEAQMVKPYEVRSVEQSLTNYLGTQTKDKIAYAMINDSLKITEFLAKNVQENIVTVEYNISSESVQQINNIKLYDSENNLLTNTSVYVPVSEDTIISHEIKIEEGL